MTTVASKNLYELLGNDHDEDSDKEPEPPVKVVDKPVARTTKRNAPAEAPASKTAAPAAARGGRRGGFGGNEGAFRDRTAGSANNRSKPTEDGAQQDRPARAEGTYGGRGRGRGGRGGNFDRHSRGVGGESEKQAAHGWGATEGGAELADEQAGEAIANAEQKEALTGDGEAGPVADAAPAAEPEPEDNSISYADYLAQQAEKKLALGTGVPEPRKPNEGSKQDKKWANAQAITKEEEEEFVAGTGGKAKRERERKQKQLVDIDYDFKPSQEAERGGRGGFRGRGEGRGRGGRGEFRGRGRGEGRGRGGADGGRSEYQGRPRGGAPRGGASLKIEDTSAFPSLGS